MKINYKTWTFFRIVRLIVAIGCFIAFYDSREWLFMMIGMIALLQTILYTGCTTAECEIPSKD
jgi:1,4-dihydroxy-2-naphthoate octaprenyltransferase